MNEELEIESTLSSEPDAEIAAEIELMSTSDTDISLVDLEGTLFHVELANMEELNVRFDELHNDIQSLTETIKIYTDSEYAPFFSADINSFSVTNTLLCMIFLAQLSCIIYKMIGGKRNV